MFRKRTVLVLGAGSSVEFNLPAGDGLAADIAKRTDFYFEDGVNMARGDRVLYDPLRTRFPEPNSVGLAGRRICEGLLLSRSIDDFLYNHGHDPTLVSVGKSAIARSILAAERQSSLMNFFADDDQARTQAVSQHSKTWLYKLFRFIQTDVRLGEVQSIFSGLSIINFNYDRCVETFLLQALQRAYGLNDGAAAWVMSTLDITHPYGQVGKLPWQDEAGKGIGFGENVTGEGILRLSDQIKTYTEQAHDDDEKAHWRDVIGEAEQLVFLGFGFHRQNMDLLTLLDGPQDPPRVYATTYRTSIADQEVFHQRIYGLLAIEPPETMHHPGEVKIDFESRTCAQMVEDIGLALAT